MAYPAKASRNVELREARARGASLRELAREFGVSHYRVAEILASTGGDLGGDASRLERTADLARAAAPDLEWERGLLISRIGRDLRRLMSIDDEIEVRRTDRILGIAN